MPHLAASKITPPHPMQAQERLQQQLNDHIALTRHISEMLEDSITQAADQLVNTVMIGSKIMVSGSGSSSMLAQIFASKMLHQYQRKRPGLPVISLDNANALLNTLIEDQRAEKALSKQINVLGQTGDSLLLINCSDAGASIPNAIRAAHEKDINLIAIAGGPASELSQFIQPQDLLIQLPASIISRCEEMQLLILHTLCDLIDSQLLGTDV